MVLFKVLCVLVLVDNLYAGISIFKIREGVEREDRLGGGVRAGGEKKEESVSY
jgi:hypothetical protein